MSRALLDGWQVHEFAPGLYPNVATSRTAVSTASSVACSGAGRSAAPLRRRRGRRLPSASKRSPMCSPGSTTTALHAAATAVRAALAVEGLAEAPVAECFALVREVCSRLLGLRHYPVQLMGGYAMLHGALAEMQTGEGKTLTAVLPAVTVALAGAPVHVITVNDYLARRDAEYLAPVYAFFGLRVGLIVPDQERASASRPTLRRHLLRQQGSGLRLSARPHHAEARRAGAARCSTAGWPGRAARSRRTRRLLRGLYYAIVDEADSVLIDEARTPLIISSDVDDPQGRATLRAGAGAGRQPERRRSITCCDARSAASN
jgi:preprotein translocase subunit SecA